jgi:hypothetical protein
MVDVALPVAILAHENVHLVVKVLDNLYSITLEVIQFKLSDFDTCHFSQYKLQVKLARTYILLTANKQNQVSD